MSPRAADTAVLFDLDSTLAHTYHRWHLSPKENPDSTWEAYSAAGAGDTPIAGAIACLRLHWAGGHQIHVVSGRSDNAMPETQAWLARHVGLEYLTAVTLRPAGNRTPNAEFKVTRIRQLRRAGVEPVLFFEDWPPVAEYITAETGVPCVVVNPCYPAAGLETGAPVTQGNTEQPLEGAL